MTERDEMVALADWLDAGASLAMNHRSKQQGEAAARYLREFAARTDAGYGAGFEACRDKTISSSAELLERISDQRRRYQNIVLTPEQVDTLLAVIWAERTLRGEASRDAFRAGWYINAAEAGDGEDQHPAEYLTSCEEVDWQEYKKTAIAALPAPGGIAPVPQLEPWRDELSEIIGHLGAATVQSTASDDQIIMDHVKAAHEIAKIVRRKA